MLYNVVKRLLEKRGYWCETVADYGSLNGACLLVDISDNLNVGIWQHTKTTVGVRFNESQYYMTCNSASQVLVVIMIVKDIKEA